MPRNLLFFLTIFHSNHCGHSFCASCLSHWYRTEFRQKLGTYEGLPPERQRPAPATDAEASALRRGLPLDIAKDVFTYSCPACRAVIVSKPQEVDIVKAVVGCFRANIQPHLVSPIDGEPTSASGTSIFAGLFPPAQYAPEVIDLTTV